MLKRLTLYLFIFVISSSFVSAGIFDWFSGKAVDERCSLSDRSYRYGGNFYCDSSSKWVEQKKDGNVCSKNFECLSFSCVEGKCGGLCSNIYSPVCGSDDVTYSNGCWAKLRGVDVAYEGACSNADKCSDGTLSGRCSEERPLYCGGNELVDNCRLCGCSEGECQTSGECLVFFKTEPVNAPSPGFDEFVCTNDFDPVCGSDGKTYSNSCWAKKTGVKISYEGECRKCSDALIVPSCKKGEVIQGFLDSRGCDQYKCVPEKPGICRSDFDCSGIICPQQIGIDDPKCDVNSGSCYCGGKCGDQICDEFERKYFTCAVDCNLVPEECVDLDGDGYGSGFCVEDCDDNNKLVHPNAEEVLNGIDDDCNGIVDDVHDYVLGEIIVTFLKEHVDDADKLIGSFGLKIKEKRLTSDIYIVVVPPGSELDWVKRFNAQEIVKYSEPIYSVSIEDPIVTTPEVRYSERERKLCESSGGKWKEFGNGCGDSCFAQENKDVVCTQAFQFSCECEGDLCWNGKTCRKPAERSIEERPTFTEECNYGCYVDESCLSVGVRFGRDYCDLNKELKSQKREGEICNNNFECSDNLCISGLCRGAGFFDKLFDFFNRFFNEEETRGVTERFEIRNCGDDFNCFIESSANCEEASVNFNMGEENENIKVLFETYLELRNQGVGRCDLYMRTNHLGIEYKEELITLVEEFGVTREEINLQLQETNEEFRKYVGLDGTCKFRSDNLVSVLGNWNDKGITGSISCAGDICVQDGDFKDAECSGKIFGAGIY